MHPYYKWSDFKAHFSAEYPDWTLERKGFD